MTTSTAVSAAEAYYLSGVGHCNSAEIIHHFMVTRGTERTDSTWIALQSIIGFGAENALKAYLAVAGMDRPELSRRELGHNLTNLLNEAKARGLELDIASSDRPTFLIELEQFISLCGPDYQSFNYRYIEGGGVFLLDAGFSTEAVIRSIQSLLSIAERKRGLPSQAQSGPETVRR